jgi:hypothetical protein
MNPRKLAPMTSLGLSLCLLCSCGEEVIYADETGDTGEPETVDTDDTSPRIVWDSQRAETADTFYGVYASGRGVYVVSSESGLYSYTSAGGWGHEELETDEEDLNAIWGQGQSETLVWVATGDAGWVVHHDSMGTMPQDLGTSNFEGIDGSGPNALVAVGWGGAYVFEGSSWLYEALPNHERLNDVWVAGSAAMAVGEEGAIVRRQGGSWVAMESPVSKALYGVDGAADNDLWAVGEDGVVLHFDGSLWTQQEAFTQQTLWDVYAPAASSVYVVGNNGTAFQYNGQTWTEMGTGVEENLYAVHGSSPTDCWAVGNRGTALHYTGG